MKAINLMIFQFSKIQVLINVIRKNGANFVSEEWDVERNHEEENRNKKEVIQLREILKEYEEHFNQVSRQSKEPSETQFNVHKLENTIKEKDRLYKELKRQYDRLKANWIEQQQENKVHINVIEEKLDVMLDKLEMEFTMKDQIIDSIKAELQQFLGRENIHETNGNGKTTRRDYTARDNSKEVDWVEIENIILKDVLAFVFEEVKQIKKENQSLRGPFEEFLVDFAEVLKQVESRNPENSVEKERKELKKILRNIVKGMKNVLHTTESPMHKKYNDNETYGNDEALREKLLHACESYIEGTKVDKKNLKSNIEILLKKKIESLPLSTGRKHKTK